MLEEMREARLAGRLIRRADLVPDHVRDHRRAPVGDDDDLQAVCQREARRPLDFRRLRQRGAGKQCGNGNSENGQ
jgi:hypothetical protein